MGLEKRKEKFRGISIGLASCGVEREERRELLKVASCLVKGKKRRKFDFFCSGKAKGFRLGLKVGEATRDPFGFLFLFLFISCMYRFVLLLGKLMSFVVMMLLLH